MKQHRAEDWRAEMSEVERRGLAGGSRRSWVGKLASRQARNGPGVLERGTTINNTAN